MNRIGEPFEESDEVKWGGFETADGRLVTYEVGNRGGWMASDGKTPNRR